jgi:hypothetical protein
MSKNKRGSAADAYYSNHLYGNFKRNPTESRVAIIERMYFRVLSELATNRFKWSGFPPEIDTRFLELTLYYHALSVFFYDDEYGKYFALQGAPNGPINMLNNPTGFRVVGNNFVGKQLTNSDAPIKPELAGQALSQGDAVPIWSNYLRVPDLDIVTIYASKFANLDRSVEINSENARQSKVITSNENQQLSKINFNRQFDEGLNGIQVRGPLQDMEFIQALDLGVNPDTILSLHTVRTRLWNECMGLLGIDNANQDKKERLVAAEVGANDNQTDMMRYVNLNARRTAAEQINEKYGLNVTVDYHSEENTIDGDDDSTEDDSDETTESDDEGTE